MTVRDTTESSPSSFVLGPADGPEGLSGGGKPLADLPLLAEGGVNQNESEVGIIGVQRDAAGGPVRIIVRMREDAGKGAVARHMGSIGAQIR